MKLRLNLGKQQALIIQDYESMAVLLSKAFGDEDNKPKGHVPQTKEEASQMFSKVFG